MRRVILAGMGLFLVVILSGCEEYSEKQKVNGGLTATKLVDNSLTQEKKEKKVIEEEKIVEIKLKEEKEREAQKKKELEKLQAKKQEEGMLRKQQEESKLKKKQEEVIKIKKAEKTKIKKTKQKKDNLRCHPSYTGKCLKINAGDYDCAGGSGNGPNYTGKVKVVGPDEFGLDRDKDGWGCE